METQATQILSLEAALLARPELPADAPESEKDRLIAEQTKTIRELEIVVRGYEENLGEPLRAVKEDVEKEWSVKLEAEIKVREEKEAWAEQLVLQLEKEKQVIVLHYYEGNNVQKIYIYIGPSTTRGGETSTNCLCI